MQENKDMKTLFEFMALKVKNKEKALKLRDLSKDYAFYKQKI